MITMSNITTLIVRKTNSTTDSLDKNQKALKKYEKSYDSEYLELYVDLMGDTKNLYKVGKKALIPVLKLALIPPKSKTGVLEAVNSILTEFADYQEATAQFRLSLGKKITLAKRSKNYKAVKIEKVKLKKFNVAKTKSTQALIKKAFEISNQMVIKYSNDPKYLEYSEILNITTELYTPISIRNLVKTVIFYSKTYKPKDRDQFIAVAQVILNLEKEVMNSSVKFIRTAKKVTIKLEKIV